MAIIDDLDKNQLKYFYEMIDESIICDEMDVETRDGYRYLDEMSRLLKISFYDMVLQLYEKDEVVKHIGTWKKIKGYI